MARSARRRASRPGPRRPRRRAEPPNALPIGASSAWERTFDFHHASARQGYPSAVSLSSPVGVGRRRFPHVTGTNRRIPAISDVTKSASRAGRPIDRNLGSADAVERSVTTAVARRRRGRATEPGGRTTACPCGGSCGSRPGRSGAGCSPAYRRGCCRAWRRAAGCAPPGWWCRWRPGRGPASPPTRRSCRSAPRTAGWRPGAPRGPHPAEVRRDNLDRVVAALDTAGIDWFRVPAESLTGHGPRRTGNRPGPGREPCSRRSAAGDAGRLEAVLPGEPARERADAPQVLRVELAGHRPARQPGARRRVRLRDRVLAGRATAP